MIEARWAGPRYLPPYSPDLNPIEQAISNIKARLRKAAARTCDRPCENIGRIIDAFTPAECRSSLNNSGYA